MYSGNGEFQAKRSLCLSAPTIPRRHRAQVREDRFLPYKPRRLRRFFPCRPALATCGQANAGPERIGMELAKPAPVQKIVVCCFPGTGPLRKHLKRRDRGDGACQRLQHCASGKAPLRDSTPVLESLRVPQPSPAIAAFGSASRVKATSLRESAFRRRS
jgi:hypothetical protein